MSVPLHADCLVQSYLEGALKGQREHRGGELQECSKHMEIALKWLYF